MPGNAGPPPPPLPSVGGGGRDDLLAAIRSTGGGHGGALRKVKDTEKRDRSAAAVPGSEAPAAPGGAPGSPAQADQGGLAGALAAALSQRKKKVSGSGEFAPFIVLLLVCAEVSANCMIFQTMKRMTMTIGDPRGNFASKEIRAYQSLGLRWWHSSYLGN